MTLALVEVGSTTKVASGANVTASNGTYDILAHSILTATANAYGLSAALGGSVQAAIARLTVKPVVLASVTGGGAGTLCADHARAGRHLRKSP